MYDEPLEKRRTASSGIHICHAWTESRLCKVIVARDIGYDGQHVHGVPENYKQSSGSVPKSEKDQYGVEHYNPAFDLQIR